MPDRRQNEAWMDEAIGTVKLAVPMATADARRAVEAVMSVVEREYTLIPKHAIAGEYLARHILEDEGFHDRVRPTWKEKIAADTARVQDLPNFITNLPGRCDSKAKTHVQRQCPHCGLWVIHEPKARASSRGQSGG